MTALTSTKRASIMLVCFALALLPLIGFSPPQAQAAPVSFADPAFEHVWMHCDKPVQDRMAVRSWMWGPQPIYTTYEPYSEGPGGQHLVQYFDKSRMEINDPAGDRSSEWFVTNGLLVVDMISGNAQVGDGQFLPLKPSTAPVAGDAVSQNQSPTYASLRKVASINGENRAPNLTGQPVNMGLSQSGTTARLENLAGYATNAVYQPTTGHNIPNVFWAFMTQKGVTYHSTGYVQNDTVVDWLFAMGYPITEPYWINVSVGGQQKWVLMQAFQRRILTYSPNNPTGWQVEMGNVGRAYYDWRYAPQPAPSPIPTPPTYKPTISLDPTSGATDTNITVWGSGFPAFSAVALGVEKPERNYYKNLRTVASRSDGSFQSEVNLPDDMAGFGDVTITATANNGALRAVARFNVSYEPSITVSPQEVVQTGKLHIEGTGFPASTGIRLGAQMVSGTFVWFASTKSDSAGEFSTDAAVASLGVGASFKVVAVADNGLKATASVTVKVLAQPHLRVLPGGGPVNVYVTLAGTDWPPNRPVNIGMKAADQSYLTWLPNPAPVDGYGNFAVQLYIDPAYAGHPDLRVFALEPVSGIQVEVSYYVNTPAPPTPPPAPREPTVSVNPSILAVGQVATVTGANWQASGIVQVGVGRTGYGVEEWLLSAHCDGNRNFAATFTLGTRWRDAGQLVITAEIPGSKSATTTIRVVSNNGRVTPGGLPMTVSSFAQAGATVYKASSQGWEPGVLVHFSVVSADGAVSTEVGSAVARNDGTVAVSFTASGGWVGRADLGLKATTMGGAHYSLRYLPVTIMSKVEGTSGTYRVTGFNWPASGTIEVIAHNPGAEKGDAQVLRTITIDAYGAFDVTFDVPRFSGNAKNEIELRGSNIPYVAWFDL